jgi:hypothetical protein
MLGPPLPTGRYHPCCLEIEAIGARCEKASKHGGSHWGYENVFFVFLTQTSLDRANNVAVDRGQSLVEQPLRCGNLRACQLCIALHPPRMVGGDTESKEPGRYGPSNSMLSTQDCATGDAGTRHHGTNNAPWSATYTRYLRSQHHRHHRLPTADRH